MEYTEHNPPQITTCGWMLTQCSRPASTDTAAAGAWYRNQHEHPKCVDTVNSVNIDCPIPLSKTPACETPLNNTHTLAQLYMKTTLLMQLRPSRQRNCATAAPYTYAAWSVHQLCCSHPAGVQGRLCTLLSNEKLSMGAFHISPKQSSPSNTSSSTQRILGIWK